MDNRFVPWQRKRKSLRDWQRRYYRIDCELLGLFDSVCRPGRTSEEHIAATSVIEQNGFTTYDSVFHGEAGKAPELGTRSTAHPLEPWTLIENMVNVILAQPITLDCKAGLQLRAAVPGKSTGCEALRSYPFKFQFAGCLRHSC